MSADSYQDNDRFNSFITRATVKPQKWGEFSGITFAIKDIIDVEGQKTTAGSAILKDNIALTNSYVASKILGLGGTIAGKTNTDEFAMDATNITSFFGPCLNPQDPARICGGSSGGSAAAVSTRLADVGIGTDTGGSTRIPASLCGVYGFKPTTGWIPMDGVVPFSRTLDTVGILAGNLSMVRKVFNGLSHGHDQNKSKTSKNQILHAAYFTSKGSRESGELKDMVFDNIPDVREIDFEKFLAEGFKIRRKIVAKEGADYHFARYGELVQDYQPQIRKFLEIGRGISDTEYKEALQESCELKVKYRELFSDFDVILCPTTEIPAPAINEVKSRPDYYRELLVRNTGFFNAVFAPSISLPVKMENSMPIGLMASSYEGNDKELLDISASIEKRLKK